jgi:muramoyltetrapeptide carboxypeptidase
MKRLLIDRNAQIALVCTGTVCDNQTEVIASADYLKKHYGFQVQFAKNTYLHLPAENRAEIFFNYLIDDAISAIWSLRGGEGSADIIPFLSDRSHLIRKSKPKLLIGFSDFTPILVYFQQEFNWPCVHGVGARQLFKRLVRIDTEHTTLNWLMNKSAQISLDDLKPLNTAALHQGKIKAPVIGGNLSLLHISLQDCWEVKPAGKILLIEEVNEPPYKVARTLKYLHRIGFFANTKAIIFGGFNFSNQSLMHETLYGFAKQCHFPVLYTNLVSHDDNNYPIPFYVSACLKLGVKPELTFTELTL